MKAWQAVDRLAEIKGSTYKLSHAAGKRFACVYEIVSQERDVKVSMLSRLCEAAGMTLCIVENPPDDAIIIDCLDDES